MMNRYPNDIMLVNYPDNENSLVDIFSIAALMDKFGLCSSIMKYIERNKEITAYRLDRMRHLPSFCSYNRPDALMFCSADYDSEQYMADNLIKLGEISDYKPLIIICTPYADKYYATICAAHGFKCFQVRTPQHPPNIARDLLEYIRTEAISEQFYYDKLRHCLSTILKGMFCNSCEKGFANMVEAACAVLTEPYLPYPRMYFYKVIGDKLGLGSLAIRKRMVKVIEGAFEKMNEEQKKYYFPLQFELEGKKFDPEPYDFIYTAARLAARPCRTLLRFMQDAPLVDTYEYIMPD